MEPQRTHQNRPVRWLSAIMLFGAILAVMLPSGAWAVGTPSGTSINNRATIDYDVGGVDQEDIESSPAGNSTAGAGAGADTTFVVDNRVDLTVVSQGNTNVSTSQLDAALEFLLTNVGNTTQGYLLEVVNGTTNIPMANVEIYIENGATAGFQAVEDTLYAGGSNAGDLNPNTGTATDAQLTAYIVADAPASATNGDTDTYWLRATTTDATTTTVTTNTAGADNPAAVDNVLADADADGAGAIDGQYDGRHADSGDFVVAASSLTVTKTHVVVSDPINGTTNPKAIPGAVIEYTVNITNAAGSAIAQTVTVSDDLTALVTGGSPQMAFNVDGYAAGFGLRLRTDTGAGFGAWTNLSNGADVDAGDWNATGANTVTVDCGNLDATHAAEVQYQLTIQ